MQNKSKVWKNDKMVDQVSWQDEFRLKFGKLILTWNDNRKVILIHAHIFLTFPAYRLILRLQYSEGPV